MQNIQDTQNITSNMIFVLEVIHLFPKPLIITCWLLPKRKFSDNASSKKFNQTNKKNGLINDKRVRDQLEKL